MSEFDQLKTVSYTTEFGPANTASRILNWPVLGIALALVSVVAWDLALLWLAVKLCWTMFS